MKFLIASLVALGVWQCAAAGPIESADVQEVKPVGECPPVDGAYPVLLPDSENKTIFYICSNGQPVMMQCPSGLEFDPNLKTCNRPMPYSPVGQCPPVDGEKPTFLPDSENATIYYECVRGTPIPMVCPPDLVFNPALNVCDWPAPTKQPNGKCPEEDDGVLTLLPDETNCSTYYICYAGTPFMATCPEGLVFNPEMKYCDFPLNVKCPEDKEDNEEEKDDVEEEKNDDDEEEESQ